MTINYKVYPQIIGPQFPPRAHCFLVLEDGVSLFMTQNRRSWIQLERCLNPISLFELETRLGTIQLEDLVDSLELEQSG